MLLQLKITEYDGEPLTQEDLRKTVHLSVTQKKSWKWEMRPSAMPHFSTTKRLLSEKNMPDENMPEEMELPISADGEVHLSIPISERTESLTVDVRCFPVVVMVQYWFWSRNVDGPVRFCSAKVLKGIGLMDKGELVTESCHSCLVKFFIISIWNINKLDKYKFKKSDLVM